MPPRLNARPLIFVLLCGYALWTIYPMVWVAYTSLKADEAVFRDAFTPPPLDNLQWENYGNVWGRGHFSRYFVNSIIVTCLSVTAICLLGSMAAYALSRFTHPLRGPLFWLFLAGLMLPAQLSAVPLFFELRVLGMLNSRAGLILVYTANGLPFAIFVLAGFFRTLPSTLYEAAVIDGCSEAGAFWRIMLPLARPGLVTVAIFQFIGIWKEYFYAFLFTSGAAGEPMRTLPLALANLAVTSQYRTDYGQLFAGLVIVILPLLLTYLLLQRHLVKGITAGALKG